MKKVIFIPVMLFIAFTVQAADIKAGKEKSVVCQGCHGINGLSQSSTWPNLAGQTASYLQRQLKKFKSGARQYASMNTIAKDLSDEDIENLAAFFASQSAPKPAAADASLVEQGKAKAAMCLGCHGGKGEGRGQFPRLAGQKAAYLEKQLKAFKSGTRKGGPMNAMVNNLSDEDIKALSAFFSSLP